MRPKVTMEIPQDACDEIKTLAHTLGWPQEAALLYAVRLVNACIREGLLHDMPERAWPAQIRRLDDTGTGGKVLAFPVRGAPQKQEE